MHFGSRMIVFATVFLTGLIFCAAQQVGATVDNERKVKGQQYVSQTVVAKVVGPNGFTNDFLDMIKNENVPIVVDNTTLVEGPNGTTSALITENVKTTVTRITIPLSTSFMDSEWYRETLRKFLQKNRLALANNTIEKEYREDGKTDVDLIILKLWAAATLRDNIVTVFGTLLYSSEHSLTSDLHSSLAHIYDLIRLRRISTVGFLDVLDNMSFEAPHEQFKILFEKLEKYVPKYLRSCVTYWLEGLYTNAINMDQLLLNKEGVLLADILSGIDRSALIPLKQKVLFSKQTVMSNKRGYEESVGKMISMVLVGIYEKSIALTRQLFAGVLLHLPLNKVTPQANEYERYFVDLVKKGNENDELEFQNIVSGLELTEFSDPYELAKAIFKALVLKSLNNRELYETMLIHTSQASSTYSTQNYDVMAPIFNSQRINMEVLLSSIVPEEYPPDIVNAKDRMLYYIDKNYIDFDFVLRGFIKYQQSTPTDLLIAVLSRIETRSNNLFPELLLTVSSLKAHIIYKQALNNLRLTLSVVDVTTLLLSFQSPNVPQYLRDIATDLRVLLQSELIDIDYKLNQQSTAGCSRPRQCVISILNYLLMKGQIRNKACEMKARELLRLVNGYGEPIGGQRSLAGNGNCAYIPNTLAGKTQRICGHLSEEQGSNEGHGFKKIYPGKHNPSLYKNYNVGRNVYQRPIFISRLSSGKIIVTNRNGEIFFASEKPELTDISFSRVPIPHPGWLNDGSDTTGLIPVLNAEEKEYMMPIIKLLKTENLFHVLNINPASYKTKGTLLADVLKKSLALSNLFDDEDGKNFATGYLRLLEYTYEVLPPPPLVTSKYFKREVNLETLLQAVSMTEDEQTEQKLAILKNLLSSSAVAMIKQEIDINSYPNKGLYFKRLLKLLLESGIVKDEEILDSVRYFEGKIMTSGYGAQPVDWIIVIGL